MGVLDFLFEGSAPTPSTSSSSTQIQLPEWYTQYTTDMLGRAQGVANLPYAQYTGPRVAGFTPTEQTGFEMTKQAATSYQPFLGQAGTTLDKAGQISGLKSAEPELGRAAGMMGFTAAQPFLGQAAGMSGAAAAQPLFERGINPIERAGLQSGLMAAQPYLASAGRTFPQAAAEYMSPYTQNVVNQIAEQGVRQLQEKYLPAVGEEFIKAGQFGPGPGSSRMGEFGARALRDVQEAVLGEQAKALQAGYGQAADIFGQDVSRMGQLAATAGQISTADLGRLLESGARIADIGAKTGQLTADDASRLAEIGRASGALTQADAANLARIGETKGQLSIQDSAALRDLASRYMNLGETTQTLGLRGAQAITGVGEKEREMQQANLNLAYQDFLRQEQYPKEQIKFLGDVLQGVRLPQTTVTQTSAMPAQPGGPSALEKAITGGTGVAKIVDLLKKYAPGKSIDQFKKSDGSYDYKAMDDFFTNLLKGP